MGLRGARPLTSDSYGHSEGAQDRRSNAVDPATGTAWERTPWHATQRAAWGGAAPKAPKAVMERDAAEQNPSFDAR